MTRRSTFSARNFHAICDLLAAKDPQLRSIIRQYNYPPMWTRPNSFETLVHIILEQQVSLASALAALNKLREKLPHIAPAKLMALTDAELKSCYFSRQKIRYVRSLAMAIRTRQFGLKALESLSDDEVRKRLTALKGIGNWTADVYLMFVLRRTDIFPIGDLAAVNAFKKINLLPESTPRSIILDLSAAWAPYRTIGTMILWHYYLSVRVPGAPRKAGKIVKALTV